MSRDAPSSWDADTALSLLHAEHYTRLVRTAALLVRDVALAEEIVQDAYVALYTRWTKLRDPDAAVGYLRQTVINGSRSALRRRGTAQRSEPLLRAAEDRTPDPASAVSARRDVLAALAGLPERQREVLVLRYYGDLSEAEIAGALGVSRGAVKSYASRGAEALRPILESLR
jgi:RNA polymerase sigma-70 factor (sigma-E family)